MQAAQHRFRKHECTRRQSMSGPGLQKYWNNNKKHEYLQEENRLLKERLGDRRIHFTDAERRRLARRAKRLGRKVLNELKTLVTPDTLMR